MKNMFTVIDKMFRANDDIDKYKLTTDNADMRKNLEITANFNNTHDVKKKSAKEYVAICLAFPTHMMLVSYYVLPIPPQSSIRSFYVLNINVVTLALTFTHSLMRVVCILGCSVRIFTF